MISRDDLPIGPGAYALAIKIETPVSLLLPSMPSIKIPPGCHIYCGSARGPGGIRARVGRHLMHEKKVRWHVDQLTIPGEIIAVLVAAHSSHSNDQTECDLLERALACVGSKIPVSGFGSSDCKICPAHLVTLAPDTSLAGIMMANEVLLGG